MKTDSEQLDREIDQARRRIAAAQMAMAEKLEIVEKQVRETVTGAQSAIDNVVTNVKGTISDTAETVRRGVDLPYQTRRHPWLAVGSAVLVGFVLGGRGGSARASKRNAYSRESFGDPMQQRISTGVLRQFSGEIGSIRSAAIGAIVSALWEIAKQSLTQSAETSKEKRGKSRSGKSINRPMIGDTRSASPSGTTEQT